MSDYCIKSLDCVNITWAKAAESASHPRSPAVLDTPTLDLLKNVPLDCHIIYLVLISCMCRRLANCYT
jgi:hypothetical protein